MSYLILLLIPLALWPWKPIGRSFPRPRSFLEVIGR
jgi:hypothetical protein